MENQFATPPDQALPTRQNCCLQCRHNQPGNAPCANKGKTTHHYSYLTGNTAYDHLEQALKKMESAGESEPIESIKAGALTNKNT